VQIIPPPADVAPLWEDLILPLVLSPLPLGTFDSSVKFVCRAFREDTKHESSPGRVGPGIGRSGPTFTCEGIKALWVLCFARSERTMKEFPRFLCGSLDCDLHKLQFKYCALSGRAEKFKGLVYAVEAGSARRSQDNLRKMPCLCFISAF
jgi:hypothetical protein